MSSEELPLPYGWVQEFDPKADHPFWVDTKANPPRAIWTHPYDDEQYLQEHPEVREKVESHAKQQDSKDSSTSKPRRHSFNGQDSTSMVPDDDEADEAAPDSSKKGKGKAKVAKRGFFGKLKDKAIGTKEEREAHRIEQARIDLERQRRYNAMIDAQRARYAQEQALYEQQQLTRQRYGPPQGNPYAYGPEYGGGYGYGYGDGYGGRGGGFGGRQNRGFGGGGGGGLPLLGALAGGLLLGDIIGGGF